MRMVRWMCSVTRLDRITNEYIRSLRMRNMKENRLKMSREGSDEMVKTK